MKAIKCKVCGKEINSIPFKVVPKLVPAIPASLTKTGRVRKIWSHFKCHMDCQPS